VAVSRTPRQLFSRHAGGLDGESRAFLEIDGPCAFGAAAADVAASC